MPKRKEVISKSVVYAGRLSEQKGVVSLIKAWSLVNKKLPEAKLKLFGQQEKDAKQIIQTVINEEIKGTITISDFISKDALFEQYHLLPVQFFHLILKHLE